MQHQRPVTERRPFWHDVAGRFADERECLASFLALEAAEVLDGEKPANLINVANRRRACGRNLYRMWQRHGATLLRQGGLVARELADRGDSLLLLLYRPQTLAALLSRPNVVGFLRKAGYSNPADLQTSLAELQSRISVAGFPHEIGVFLGYPLKDVAGFMGWAPLPFTCQGPWKIYGDPTGSLGLAETFRQSRCRMARRLARCATPVDCLQVVGSSAGNLLFGERNENEYHYTSGGSECA
ncbi:MAG TPA: DUF3793 family protein [Desulfuromonadales bacterium]